MIFAAGRLCGGVLFSDLTKETERTAAYGVTVTAVMLGANSTDRAKVESVKIDTDDPGKSVEKIFVCVFDAPPSDDAVFAPGTRLAGIKGKFENGSYVFEKPVVLSSGKTFFGVGVASAKSAKDAFSIQVSGVKVNGEEIDFTSRKVHFKVENNSVPFQVKIIPSNKNGIPVQEVVVTPGADVAFPPMISLKYKNFALKDYWKDAFYRLEMTKNPQKNEYSFTVPLLTPLSGNGLKELPISYHLIPPPNSWQLRADNTGRDILDGDPIALFYRAPGGVRWLGVKNPCVEFDLKGIHEVCSVEVFYLFFKGTFKVYARETPDGEYKLIAQQEAPKSTIPFGPSYMPQHVLINFPPTRAAFLKLEADSEYCLTEVVLWGKGDAPAVPESAAIFVTGKNGKTTLKVIQLQPFGK